MQRDADCLEPHPFESARIGFTCQPDAELLGLRRQLFDACQDVRNRGNRPLIGAHAARSYADRSPCDKLRLRRPKPALSMVTLLVGCGAGTAHSSWNSGAID